MAYKDRRVTCRQMKTISFTITMFIQVAFWMYVILVPSSTNSQSNRQLAQREINQHLEEELIQPRPPRMVKPLMFGGEQISNDDYTKRINAVPKQVNTTKKPKTNVVEQTLRKEDKPNNHVGGDENPEVSDEDYHVYFNTLLHHTILHRNASIIWTKPFVLNPTTLCSRHRDLDLLVIVHTAPYNFRRRTMIRQQISNRRLNFPYTVQPVFMIGSVRDEKRNITNEANIETEHNVYGDIVKMEFLEDFRNLSLKAVMWLKWTNEFCTNANMILKIDDDVVLDIQKILPLSRGLFSKFERSIFCHLNKIGSQPIPRIGRTEVDPREFMRLSFYPYNYCSGFIVFLTPDLIPALEKSARKIPFYNVDDVFMFGMVPKFAGNVAYHNIGYNVSIWNEKVLKCSRERGSLCPYFGTMAEKQEERLAIWNVMKNNHAHDFQFPKLHIGIP